MIYSKLSFTFKDKDPYTINSGTVNISFKYKSYLYVPPLGDSIEFNFLGATRYAGRTGTLEFLFGPPKFIDFGPSNIQYISALRDKVYITINRSNELASITNLLHLYSPSNKNISGSSLNRDTNLTSPARTFQFSSVKPFLNLLRI